MKAAAASVVAVGATVTDELLHEQNDYYYCYYNMTATAAAGASGLAGAFRAWLPGCANQRSPNQEPRTKHARVTSVVKD